VHRTLVRVNRQFRYRITVEFEAMGSHRTTYNAYGPDVERAYRWMDSRTVLHVLYLRDRPEQAAVIEQLLT
jgi:hypothetical protein